MYYQRGNKRRKSRRISEVVFPAPVRGLLRQGTLIGAPADAAEVLDNFWTTAEGIELRGGSAKVATIGGSVGALPIYTSGSQELLFAANMSAVYNITSPADPDVAPIADVAGMVSADWSTIQFATPGGQFLLMVNGTDYMLRFDGTDWNPTTGEALFTLGYDALTADFEIGETVTGGTSGATATIYGIQPTSATAGTLVIGAVTGGPFQDNEALTSASGAAVANGTVATGSTVAVTGVDTRDLSFIWSHQRRVWFVEGDTLSAWYLPVNSIGGAAAEFPLDGVFRLGGKLLFGGTWSQDSGDGIDDYMIFVTDQGEIAAYQGTDPSSASTWALIGVYKVGKPLNKAAWFRAGGDFVILTEDGIVSVADAVNKDRAALQVSAITAPIEDLWQDIIVSRSRSFNFSASIWATKTRLLIGAPDPSGGTVVLCANTRTGAWSTVSGWDVQCSTIWTDRFIFGTSDGQIVRGDTTGTDMGLPFSGTYVPKFQDFNNGNEKIATHARVMFQSEERARPQLACFANYEIGDFPVAEAPSTVGGDVWGTGVWGTSVWGAAGTLIATLEWQGVAAQGFSLAPAIILQSNQISASSFRLVATQLRYETGRGI